jgi:glycosyltransferase involved in cell wall biosynthesis
MGIARDLPVVLDVVGDGFDRAECEMLASQMGLRDRVHFHGRVDRQQVDGFYERADIFLFPSYREPGGNVVFEAMGYGLPLIVSDNGGPGAAVDETCGIRVRAQSEEQYATDLAAAIARLAADRETRLALGEGARRRVADIALWDNKVLQLEAIWDSVVDVPKAERVPNVTSEPGV